MPKKRSDIQKLIELVQQADPGTRVAMREIVLSLTQPERMAPRIIPERSSELPARKTRAAKVPMTDSSEPPTRLEL